MTHHRITGSPDRQFSEGDEVAEARITVMYPHPKDVAAFEKAYADEHIPMAVPVFTKLGATRAVLTKVTGSPMGAPAFYRVAEIYFPTLQALQAAAMSAETQKVVAHAFEISTGGPPTMLIGEVETVAFT